VCECIDYVNKKNVIKGRLKRYIHVRQFDG